MTTQIDIERKRGDTRRHIFVVKDAAGAIVDIAAWSNWILTIDPEKAPADALNNIESITGVNITDGTDGRVGFTPAGTAPVGSYFYDVQAVDANGEKTTVAEGKYKVTQDITKV